MSPEEYADIMRQLNELLARMTAQAATPLSPPAPTAHRDRLTFGQIALLCKRALEQPPFDDVYRVYLLDIARLCKQALERDTRETR